MDETYFDIPGTDGYMIDINGNVYSKKSKRVIKSHINGSGYKCVMAFMNGSLKLKFIHKCIALVFIPNPSNYSVVNHINGIKTDNRIENLEWCTHSENLLHAYRTGLKRHISYNKKKILDTNTGIIYNSLSEAADTNGIKRTTLNAMLIGQNKNKTTLIYLK